MGNFKIGQLYDEALRKMQPSEIKQNLEEIQSLTKSILEVNLVIVKEQ